MVARAHSELVSSIIQVNDGYFRPIVLSALPQDGGLYDSYTIWHNYFSSVLERDQAPMPLQVRSALWRWLPVALSLNTQKQIPLEMK